MKQILFHGSPFRVSELLPPEQTGNIRKGEEERSHHRDVIFLTSNIDMARSYAGKGGVIYVVEATARPYNKHERKRAGKKYKKKRWATKQNPSVWVARPKEIQILSVVERRIDMDF